jgi:hypothetical protein
MRASRFVAAALTVAIVGAAVLNLSHGLASASSMYDVCKNTQLSFTKQSQCIDDMKAAKSDTARNDVAAHYQAMIDAKAAAEQGMMTPSSSGPSTPTAQQTAPTTPN